MRSATAASSRIGACPTPSGCGLRTSRRSPGEVGRESRLRCLPERRVCPAGRASWFVDGLSRLGLGAYVEVDFREYLTVYSQG
jgi:hypothetical protein